MNFTSTINGNTNLGRQNMLKRVKECISTEHN
jgi:hypothetical protein